MATAATSLENGFFVGDWRIDPRAARATRAGEASVDITPDQLQVLIALAARHGEAVDRKTLRSLAWPGEAATEDKLRETIARLRELLGDRPRQPRYITTVGHEGYALIAHFELAPAPIPSPSDNVGATPVATRSSRLYALLGELRRRNVVKVAASYLLGSWIVLQVAEVTFAPLRFPEWWLTVLTILAVLGLPIVVALAWTYEITPQGVIPDPGSGGGGAVNLPRRRQSIAPFVVTGVALAAAVTGFAWWKTLDVPVAAVPTPVEPAPEPGAQSIAVLPLVDMSAAGGNAYLGDGLSEELSTRLAQVPGLRVAARTSAFEFKGRNVDVRKIGQALGVRHVLEGSVRRDGDNVRVTVQLIDTKSGYHLWAGNFDRAWRDVLTVQDDVARSVTDALKVVLTDKRLPGTRSPGTAGLDARAIDPYLAGRALLRRSGDRSSLEEATRHFEEALAVDPSFGRAWAGLCEAAVALYRRTRDPADLGDAERACEKALRVSPGLVESERALAALYVTGGRFESALAVYRGLLERDHRNADDHIGVARALEGLGRIPEAEQSFRRATEVEPAYWGAFNALGGFLFAHGRIEEAAAAYRRVTEMVPSSASAHNNLGAALYMKGDVIGAVQAYERSLQLEPSRSAYSNLASCYYYAGRYQDAIRMYEKATAEAPNDQTLWGNLADAQWQVRDLRRQATENYGRAIRLAERDLSLGAPDPVLLAQLAYYHCRIGDCARGEQYLGKAVAAGTKQMYVQYFAALVAADRDDQDGAARAAAEAVRLGYPAALLKQDPTLKARLGASPGHRT